MTKSVLSLWTFEDRVVLGFRVDNGVRAFDCYEMNVGKFGQSDV